MRMLVVHKDYDGNKIAEFIGRGRRGTSPGGLQWAGYYKRLRTAGAFTLSFNANDTRVLDFEPYHHVEFWLRDEFGGSEYDAFLAGLPTYQKNTFRPGWYRDFTGLVLTEPQLNQSSDGTFTSQILGRGLNQLLFNEYVDYAPTTSEASKSGAAETVAKEFVDENIGPGAGADAGGNTRVRAGVTVETDAGTGATWAGDRSRKLLADVLQEVADVGPGDYMIVQTGDAAFQFQWRSPHWGLDKRLGNGVRRPALFSARVNNVEDVSSIVSYLNAITGAIVYGQGVGPGLKPGTAYDTTLTAATSLARRVTLRQSSRQEVSQTSLDNAAFSILRDNRVEVNVDATVKEIVSSRYNVHWGIGDLTTIEDTIFGRQIDRKVVGVRVNMRSRSGSDPIVGVTPEFGDFIDA